MGKASSLSTKKQLRQSRKRQAINKSNRTRLKGQLKKARATEGNDRKKMLPEAYEVIDKMVKKGIIHRNAAARYKSRLAKPKSE